MKTTLDLPPDVARTLRLESARRGGRRIAPLSRLVADAVREVYGSPRPPGEGIDLRPGRVVIAKCQDGPLIDSAAIHMALDD